MERVTGIEPAWPAWKAWDSKRHTGWSAAGQPDVVPSACLSATYVSVACSNPWFGCAYRCRTGSQRSRRNHARATEDPPLSFCGQKAVTPPAGGLPVPGRARGGRRRDGPCAAAGRPCGGALNRLSPAVRPTWRPPAPGHAQPAGPAAVGAELLLRPGASGAGASGLAGDDAHRDAVAQSVHRRLDLTSVEQTEREYRVTRVRLVRQALA